MAKINYEEKIRDLFKKNCWSIEWDSTEVGYDIYINSKELDDAFKVIVDDYVTCQLRFFGRECIGVQLQVWSWTDKKTGMQDYYEDNVSQFPVKIQKAVYEWFKQLCN